MPTSTRVQVLSSLTTVTNVVGLAVAVCLGFYVVTRSPRSRSAWLATATLWLLAGLFVYNAWAMFKPWGATVLGLRPITFLVLPAWFHLALLLPDEWAARPAPLFLPPLRLRLPRPAAQAAAPLVYSLAVALLLAGIWPLGRIPAEAESRFVLLADRIVAPSFALGFALLVAVGTVLLAHLWFAAREARNDVQRRLCHRLLLATAVAGAGGLYLVLGAWLRAPLPAFVGDLAVVAATALLGYAVAEYQAWVQGRTLRQDLIYGAVAMVGLAIAAVAIAESLYLSGHTFSLLTIMVIIIAVISFLMLYDGLRTTWDRLFYHEQLQQLRANLRALAREAGAGQTLPERLQTALQSMCHSLGVGRGLVALRDAGEFRCEAVEGGGISPAERLPASTLLAPDIADLPRSEIHGLAGLSLLVPLFDGDEQTGVLLLGPKKDGTAFGDQDRLFLENAAEQLATLIHDSRLQDENARLIAAQVADFRDRERALQRQVQDIMAERREDAAEGAGDEGYVAGVEDALRRLHDYDYLGEHSLARLAIVDRCLEGRNITYQTHLDRGRAVSEVLVEAMDKLRPPGSAPRSQAIPPREWHAYVVLHDAYVLGEPNRDIMSRLYVSEGTFNRTRRQALRGVARALAEMDRQAQQTGRPV